MMLVLGIDPGSVATGWGLVRRERGRYRALGWGVVRTRSKTAMPQRLHAIHAALAEVIAGRQPDVVAIEAIFKHKSSESALRLGQARGVALLAAAQGGLEVHDYNAMTVKKTVTGYGRADKGQMMRVVSMLLGVSEPIPSDAADALAIAMTHLAFARTPTRSVG